MVVPTRRNIGNPAPRSCESTEADITRLIESLNSLLDGDLAVDALVGYGKRAIPQLSEFLLHGRPSVVHQPRQRAVRALAELGAKEVLVGYLTMPKPIADAQVRFSEEAVENAAGRALAGWKTEDVFQALLDIARSRKMPGVIEALGQFGRPEAIPFLIAALGDDVARRGAEHGLRAIGETARAELVEAARTPDPSRREESPASLARRRSALRILVSLPPATGTWPKLQCLLRDEDADIAVSAATIALKFGTDVVKETAVRRLIEVLPAANWLTQSEVESLLLEHLPVAGRLIQYEIQQRTQLPKTRQATDVTLRLLLSVMRHAMEAIDRRSPTTG